MTRHDTTRHDARQPLRVGGGHGAAAADERSHRVHPGAGGQQARQPRAASCGPVHAGQGQSVGGGLHGHSAVPTVCQGMRRRRF